MIAAQWIDSMERLPAPGVFVLIADGSSMDVRFFIVDDGVHAWGWYPGGRHPGGTYWMPLPPQPGVATPPAAVPRRILYAADPWCPQCGHNRDRSSVSSIVHYDGTRSCQMCGARWAEVA